ncbi:MAG: OmpH family outer membrane protein [Blastocatellia bacterium]|nr:OmpH family outer membrane protein [Blastocatellia bacterium]
MKTKISLTLAVMLFAVSGVWAQTAAPASGGPVPNMKVAIVDVIAFREGILELRAKYEKLQTEFQARYRELEAMQSKIQSQEKVLNENKTLTPQQAQKLTEEYEQMKREYNRLLEDSQSTAQKREREETEASYDKLSKFMDQYCVKNKITHVFDAQRLRESQIVVYAAAAANITEDFIKEFNKSNPAPAATAKQ